MTRVFVLAGQSNMAGAGVTDELPESWRSPLPNVRLFQDGEWRDLLWRKNFGPEVGLARELAARYPDEQIVLCKVARGGANLYYDWNPDGVSKGPEDDYRGPMYPLFKTELQALKALLTAAGETFCISGMFWMQGERDSVIEIMADAYERNLTDFIATVRRDVGVPDLPFIQGQIAPRKYVLNEGRFQHAHRVRVQDAQRRVAANVTGAGLAETMDLPQSDNLHFDTAGQLVLARRYVEAYAALSTIPS